MRSVWLVAVVGLMLAQVPEPAEFPEGTVCTPKGIAVGGRVVQPDHPCHCQRFDASDSCEGEPTHDQACRQWCHENKCGCPVVCIAGEH